MCSCRDLGMGYTLVDPDDDVLRAKGGRYSYALNHHWTTSLLDIHSGRAHGLKHRKSNQYSDNDQRLEPCQRHNAQSPPADTPISLNSGLPFSTRMCETYPIHLAHHLTFLRLSGHSASLNEPPSCYGRIPTSSASITDSRQLG
jgi:hypothetical protein